MEFSRRTRRPGYAYKGNGALRALYRYGWDLEPMFAATPTLNSPLPLSSASEQRVGAGATLMGVVLAFLAERNRHGIGPAKELGPASRVFDDGLIDSLTFIELIARIETALAVRIDMLALDLDAIHTVADLIEQTGRASEPKAG